MSEGEFKKRIEAFVLDFYRYYKEGNLPRNDKALIDAIVDEAKKEFPLAYHDLDELATALKEQSFLALNNSGAIQIIRWFVKWFGSEEKKGEKPK